MKSGLVLVALGCLACDAPASDTASAPLRPSSATPGAAVDPGHEVPSLPDVATPSPLGATGAVERVRVLVRFDPDAARDAAYTFLQRAGARLGYRYRLVPELVSVRELPLSDMTALAKVPGVAEVTRDEVRHADLTESRALMHASTAEMVGYSNGAGVRVCVLDTGISQTHPAFAGAIVAQHDFVADDAIAQDDNGHGTNVAGIVASRDAQYGGVAPGASLVVAKVLDANGSGYDSDIIAAIEWCTLDVAGDVVNMSLGGGKYYGTCDTQALARAVIASVDAGVVNVAAAGNDGNSDAVGQPACASRALAVAAVYDAPKSSMSWCLNAACSERCTDSPVAADLVTCFSNRSMKIDVAAPGSAITAPSAFSNGFASMSGTSQATPHVAGLIARLLGERPEMRPSDVRRWLWRNADDLGPSGFDVAYGHGRVDALATLEDTAAITCATSAECADDDPCTIDRCETGFCAHRATCDDDDARTADRCDAGTCSYSPITADDGLGCTSDALDACVGPLHVSNGGACNATCATAIALPFGVDVQGTTVGATKTIDSSCGGIAAAGANVVYRVSLRPEQAVTFKVTTTSTTWDPVLYLVPGTSASACDLTRCVAGSNVVGASKGETLTRVHVPVTGDYFLVVDTSSSTTTGAFSLRATVACDPDDEGRACDDGNACTVHDLCQGSVCVGGDAGDTCDRDADCADGDACNGAEACVEGACVPGAALACDDHAACTTDTCVPASGCVFTPRTNGTSCTDGDSCNGAETCQAGVCSAGTAPSCDDHNPCTADRCDPVAGCMTTALEGTSCSNGNVCDGIETCHAGVCGGGKVAGCDDGNPCTDDRCDPVAGCLHSDAASGTRCDDGDACTSGDQCAAGVCGGTDSCHAGSLLFGVAAAHVTLPGGIVVANEDLARYDLGTHVYSLYFDGSDVGLAATSVVGFAYWENGDLVLAFKERTNLPGLVGGPAGNAVDVHDLVRFTPRTLGATTSGTFTFLFDGSDVGLTKTTEALDAVAVLADGSILISTTGAAAVPGVSAAAQDVMRFVPSALGAQTAGTWSMWFDGSDVGLSGTGENVDGLAVLADGSMLLSTSGAAAVTGVSCANEDALRFVPSHLGAVTAGQFSIWFDGSANGFNDDARSITWRDLP